MSGIILNDGIQKYTLIDVLNYCYIKRPIEIAAFISLLKHAEIEFEFLLTPDLQVLNISNGLKHIAAALKSKYLNKKLDPEVVDPLLLDMRIPHKSQYPDISGIIGLVAHIDQRTEFLWADLMSSTKKVHLGYKI